MRIGAFELEEPLPRLREPHALAMLRPWIDVGGVGGLVLARLEDCLEGQHLGGLVKPGSFFDFTRYRPTLYYEEESRELAIPNTLISWAEGTGDNDFLFLYLLEPHMMSERYVDSVIRVLERLGVKRYWLLGSMYDVVPHTRPLIVSGGSSREEGRQALERLGIKPSGYQGPTSIAVLISQEAPKRGMETITAIVHLPQYAQLEEDHAGELRLLEVLSSFYNLPVDLDEVKKEAEKQYEELTTAVGNNPQAKEMVAQLETYYDGRASGDEEDEDGLPRLSPEVERFLKDIDKRFGQG